VSARQTGHVFVARFSLHSTAAAHVPIRGKRHRTVALPSSRGHAAGLSAIRVTRGRALAKIGFRSIRKSFGDTAVLHDVSLDIGDGEFMTFVGPSGCGKTTLLRILAGLEVQDSGEVRLGERVVDRLPPKQRDIAMVFQSYALYPYMTVAENIALPLTMRRLSAWQRLPLLGRFIGTADSIRRGIDADVTQTAMALGLERLLSRRPGQLSGGQRQRVALDRAMVRHPSAFLMDEPLSNLDAKLRVQARTEISELHRRIGGTFVYVTHDQVEAMTMSDRVAVMIDGRLLQVAAPQRLYAEPDDLRVAEFIGSPRINTLDGIVDESGRVVVLGQALPVAIAAAAGEAVTVGLRPEALSLGGAGHAARVHHLENLGVELLVHLRLPSVAAPLIARVAPDRFAELKVGDPINVCLASARVLAFGRDNRRLEQRQAAATARTNSMAQAG
jgi:multiple sugar transport system ATP-binding protein